MGYIDSDYKIKKFFLLNFVLLFATVILNVAAYFSVLRINGIHAQAKNTVEQFTNNISKTYQAFNEIMSKKMTTNDIDAMWGIFNAAEKDIFIISNLDQTSDIKNKMEAFKGSILDIISAKNNPAVDKAKLKNNYEEKFRELWDSIRNISLGIDRNIEKQMSGLKLVYFLIIVFIFSASALSFLIGKKFASTMRELQNNLVNELKETAPIFDSLGDAIIITNPATKIKRCNLAAAKMLSRSKEELLDINLAEILETFKKLLPEFAKVSQLRKTLLFKKENAVIGDIERVINIKLFPVERSENIVVIIEDITSENLQQCEIDYEEKITTFKRLIAVLVQNFSGLLSGIMNAANIINHTIESNEKSYNGALKQGIDTIEKLTERAYFTIQRLNTFTEDRTCKLQPVDINILIKNLIKKCESIFDESIQISVSLPKEHIFMKADPLLLEQVLFNILENAAHAITLMRRADEEWGGIIEVSLDKIYPDRNYRQIHPLAVYSAYWLISIADNGIGIKPEYYKTIFDPFFTMKEDSAGIGLAIAYEIVKNHGGFIECYSQPEKGSRFTVFLPDNL